MNVLWAGHRIYQRGSTENLSGSLQVRLSSTPEQRLPSVACRESQLSSRYLERSLQPSIPAPTPTEQGWKAEVGLFLGIQWSSIDPAPSALTKLVECGSQRQTAAHVSKRVFHALVLVTVRNAVTQFLIQVIRMRGRRMGRKRRRKVGMTKRKTTETLFRTFVFFCFPHNYGHYYSFLRRDFLSVHVWRSTQILFSCISFLF